MLGVPDQRPSNKKKKGKPKGKGKKKKKKKAEEEEEEDDYEDTGTPDDRTPDVSPPPEEPKVQEPTHKTWNPPPDTPTSDVSMFKTLRLRQDGRRFANNIFKCIFLNKNFWILNKISLKNVP